MVVGVEVTVVVTVVLVVAVVVPVVVPVVVAVVLGVLVAVEVGEVELVVVVVSHPEKYPASCAITIWVANSA